MAHSEAMQKTKRYIGDGCYVAFDGYALWLTTENGVSVINEICLEPEVYKALLVYVQSLRVARQSRRHDRRECIMSDGLLDSPFGDGASKTILGDIGAAAAPRIIARITEEDTQTYHLRCERGWCAQLSSVNVYESLTLAAHDARAHAVRTGHAVLVEAL